MVRRQRQRVIEDRINFSPEQFLAAKAIKATVAAVRPSDSTGQQQQHDGRAVWVFFVHEARRLDHRVRFAHAAFKHQLRVFINGRKLPEVRFCSVYDLLGSQCCAGVATHAIGNDRQRHAALARVCQDGDAILVPPRSMVAVLGEVREPGVKQLVAGSKVSSVLALAGGLNREGDERKARLMRADGSLVELDLRELLSGRKPELDIELKSGDALLVPPIDLSQVARDAADHALVARKGITVKVIGADEPAVVEADIRRIDRIVRNLMTNAAKYSGSDRIEIEVAQNDQCVSLAVRDFGVGLSDDESIRVFDRFWRADPARTQGGTGLGLAICKRIVTLMGGTISVESTEGRGSHFTFTVTLEAPPAGPHKYPTPAPACLLYTSPSPRDS